MATLGDLVRESQKRDQEDAIKFLNLEGIEFEYVERDSKLSGCMGHLNFTHNHVRKHYYSRPDPVTCRPSPIPLMAQAYRNLVETDC